MKGESLSSKAWLAAHPHHYNILFDEGRMDEAAVSELTADQTSVQQVALSALARYRDTARRLPTRITNEITSGVEYIFEGANRGDFTMEPAFLDEMDWKMRTQLKVMTTQAVLIWQSGCTYFRHRPAPFANLYSRQGVQLDNISNSPIELVLTAAAALHYAAPELPVLTPKPVRPWVRNVALYGPAYTRELLGKEGESSKRIRSISSAYSVSNLAEKLGWPEEKVRGICPDRFRLVWSNNSKRKPAEIIEHIRKLDEEVLSYESLARELAMTKKQVKGIFTFKTLRKFYKYPWIDPIPDVRRIVRQVREISNDFELPYNICCWLAVRAPKSGRYRASIVRRDMYSQPAGLNVSAATWARAIAEHPDSVENRIARIRKSQASAALYFAIKSPLPMLRAEDRDIQLSAPDPSDAIQDHESLETVIEASGLHRDQVSQLMDFFNHSSSGSPPAYIQELLAKLRHSAQVLGMRR